MKINSCLSDGP